MDSALLDIFSGNNSDSFYFADPSIRVELSNSVGAAFDFDSLYLQPISRTGLPIPFTTSVTGLHIPPPAAPGQGSNSVMLLDNSNSTVQALAPGQTLTETFIYTMKDTANVTSTANLVITINGANDAPVAKNNTYTTEIGRAHV